LSAANPEFNGNPDSDANADFRDMRDPAAGSVCII
jgi:hypothetical protein